MRKLLAEDESLTHQVVDTFASVAESDLSWTEKIWTTAHARAGGLQLVLGIGKYTNRGVLDCFAGVARGTEQWTVRGSRTLGADYTAGAGPIRYEVTEALRTVRLILEPSKHAPVSFDVTLTGVVPPSVEEAWPDRTGGRLSHHVLRYHQAALPEGWLEVDGERHEVTLDTWVGFRDHSWGLRPGVGAPIPGLPRAPRPYRSMIVWCPMLLERADGSLYALFAMYQHQAGRGFEELRTQAELQEGADVVAFAGVIPRITVEDTSRRLIGGHLDLLAADGSIRSVAVTPVSETGFHLGTSHYFGYQGHFLGESRGDLHLDGDHVCDTHLPEVARQVNQLRDVLVRVQDPIGGGVGFGNLETMLIGAYPEVGTTAEATFL